MAIDAVAMSIACFMMVPGLLFMATNKHVASGAVKEAGFDAKVNPEIFALAAYCTEDLSPSQLPQPMPAASPAHSPLRSRL